MAKSYCPHPSRLLHGWLQDPRWEGKDGYLVQVLKTLETARTGGAVVEMLSERLGAITPPENMLWVSSKIRCFAPAVLNIEKMT